VDAYNALLQGNFYGNRGTAEDYRKAIGSYEEAIRLDPRYALAYAKHSTAAWNLGNRFAGEIMTPAEREGLNAKARSSADKAIELDPNLGPAHAAKGTILQNLDADFAAAEAAYRRALDLAPRDPAAVANSASLSAKLGRLDEAVAIGQRAVALDPLRGGVHMNLAGYLAVLGRYDEGEAAARKAIEVQPKAPFSYRWLAEIAILRGKPAAAVELGKQVPDPFWRTYVLAKAYFANGERPEADAALKKLIDENADDCGTQIAAVYALRKEPDKMFEWLEHAWTTHDVGVTELLSNPLLRAYKDDPRFIAFAQKIGVMPNAGGDP
jgi:tetratricopeptide (TPR) repeat protein